ncbi:MAG: hypothetical protein IJW46_05000 [Clostridia bacterium]|nr:hypothetical protein [Clostridia bacterium]
MQITLKKYKKLPSLLAGTLLAAAISFYILSRLATSFWMLLVFPFLSGLFLALTLYTVGRYLTYDLTYRIGGNYSDFTFSVHHIRQKESSVRATYEMIGSEELILLDRAGRKRLKKQKKLATHTVNLIPKSRYALFCTVEGESGYLLLELDESAKNALSALLKRANTLYSVNADTSSQENL